jgi:hypothetical protein
MTNPISRMSLKRRTSLIIWAVNIILCLTLVFFVLR